MRHTTGLNTAVFILLGLGAVLGCHEAPGNAVTQPHSVPFKVHLITDGLEHPWSMAFLRTPSISSSFGPSQMVTSITKTR